MPGRADNGQHFTGIDVQVEAVDHRAGGLWQIGKTHLLEMHLATGPGQVNRLKRVEDLRRRVEQQEDPLGRGGTGGIAFEQVGQLLQGAQEQHHVEQALAHLADCDGVRGQAVAADQHQHRHAGRGKQGGKGCEPARAQTADDQRVVEGLQQLLVARQVRRLLAVLLQQAHAADALDQVRGKAAALFGDLRPVALGDAFEGPGRRQQQGHATDQAEEEQRFDQPQHHGRQATAQQGAEQLGRALDE
ncbi:hypothetical protein D9M71_542250 [compost metagenome]